MKKWIFFLLIACLVGCNAYKNLPPAKSNLGWKTKVVPASPQLEDGDPELGYDYVINGNYIGSGMPFDLIKKRIKKRGDTILQREGLNQDVVYALTAFEASNGIEVVNGNCLTCHASEFNGEIVVGLGNSFSDFRTNMKPLSKGLRFAMKLKYGKKSPEWAAYQDFDYYFSNSAPYIETNQPGVNPAAHLAEACVAYRDPQTLEFTGDPILDLPDYVLVSDVPPLWNV